MTDKKCLKTSTGFSTIGIIVLTALIVGGGVYIWKTYDIQPKEEVLKNDQILPTELVKEPTKVVGATNTPTAIPTKAEPATSLSSVDATWNMYTNNALGFSMKVPKKMFSNYGFMCKKEGVSYRPVVGMVPVKIIDGTSVNITSEYFYKLTGETVVNNINNYAGCEKTIITQAVLDDKASGFVGKWTIVAQNVKNESELDAFIKTRYGSGCSVGDKKSTAQDGVYDVSIKGDGKEMEDSQCVVNYMTVLKYAPAKQKVISWHMGQAPTFMAEEGNNQTVYDEEMKKSFLMK